MKQPPQTSDSHVLIMRVWVQPRTSSAQVEIRGKVQHIMGEEVRSFDDWTSLTEAIGYMLSSPPAKGSGVKTTR
jgi:hypothetical protein